MNKNMMDIGSKDVALKVWEVANRLWYESMLCSMQKEAFRLGYLFVKTQSMEKLPPTVEELPPIVAEQLAYALSFQRERHLYPLKETCSIERAAKNDFKDGYAQAFLRSVLEGLLEAGIGLQAGQEALERVRVEESRRNGLLIRCASNLLEAAQIHVKYNFPKLLGEDAKIANIETLLSLSEFDSELQLVIFLQDFSYSLEKQKGWVDLAGQPTTKCPAVIELLAPMLSMGNLELSEIRTLALEQLRSNAPVGA